MQDAVEPQQPARNKTDTQKPVKTEAKQTNSKVVTGVTFYKAEEESYREKEEDENVKDESK